MASRRPRGRQRPRPHRSQLHGSCFDIGQGQPVGKVGGKLRRWSETQPLQRQSDATNWSDRGAGTGQELEADPVLGREGSRDRPRLLAKDRYIERDDRAGAWIAHASHLERAEGDRRPGRDEQLVTFIGAGAETPSSTEVNGPASCAVDATARTPDSTTIMRAPLGSRRMRTRRVEGPRGRCRASAEEGVLHRVRPSRSTPARPTWPAFQRALCSQQERKREEQEVTTADQDGERI